jgi:hypothetical protein
MRIRAISYDHDVIFSAAQGSTARRPSIAAASFFMPCGMVSSNMLA